MSLLSDLSIGYLTRQQQEQERTRKEDFERSRNLLAGAADFLQQQLPNLREEARPAALQNLAQLMSADPYRLNPKKAERLANQSLQFLWQGMAPEKAAPQTLNASLPQQGMPNLDISAVLAPLEPPQGYRQSPFVSERERANQADIDAMAKDERATRSALARYRGQKQIDQEFETIAPPKAPEMIRLGPTDRLVDPTNFEVRVPALPQAERPDTNLNEVELAMAAAQGDPAAREALTLLREQKQQSQGSTRIDPLSPEGIAARLEFERGRPVRSTASGTPAAAASAQPPQELSGLAKMVLADPSIIRALTPTQRGQLMNELGNANITPETLNRSFVQKSMEAIDALKTMPGKSGAVGAKGPTSAFGLLDRPLAGTNAANFVTHFDNLMSMIALPNLELMRGLGAMSDREFNNITASASALSRDLSEKAFDAELEKLRRSLEAVQKRMQLVPAYTGGALPSPSPGQRGAASSDTVRVKAPNGQTGTILRSKLQDAINRGYTEIKE